MNQDEETGEVKHVIDSFISPVVYDREWTRIFLRDFAGLDQSPAALEALPELPGFVPTFAETLPILRITPLDAPPMPPMHQAMHDDDAPMPDWEE